MGVTSKSSISNIIISYTDITIEASEVVNTMIWCAFSLPHCHGLLGLEQVLELAAFALLAATLFLLLTANIACQRVLRLLQYI